MRKHKHEPVTSDESKKEQIGEAVMFLAALGEFRLANDDPIKSVDLALYLINTNADMHRFWDSRNVRQKLQIVQHLQPKPGIATRIEYEWYQMLDEARRELAERMRVVCASAYEAIAVADGTDAIKALGEIERAAA